MVVRILLLLIFAELAGHGFTKEIKILTDSGLDHIAELSEYASIVSQDLQLQRLRSRQIFYKDSVIKITVADQVIICAKEQLFWSVEHEDWLAAVDFAPGDHLLSAIFGPLEITAIELVDQPHLVYGLTVDPPHELLVGSRHIIAHNITPFLSISFLFAFGEGIQFVGTTVFAGFIAFGLYFGAHFAKDFDGKLSCEPGLNDGIFYTPGPPLFPNDDDEDDEQSSTHPYGVYKGASYHKSIQNGRKSPAPKNGQRALDRSIAVEGNARRRVSVCDGEIVIFNKTAEGEYHGYTMTWDEIVSSGYGGMEDVQTALIANRLITRKGKLLV